MNKDARFWDLELLGTRRISLVGRAREQRDIQSGLNNLDHHTLVYWEGDGGIGKTALLEYAIEQAKERGDFAVVDLIDLYHVDYQTPAGLAKAIVEGIGSDAFQEYSRRIKELSEKARSGEEVAKELERAWSLFVKELSDFAAKRKVLITLDTVEVLQYEHLSDPFQEFARQNLPLASVGRWLLEKVLPNIKRESSLMWFWAGRRTELASRIPNNSDRFQFIRRNLSALSEDDSKRYLENVATEIYHQDEQGASAIMQYINTNPKGIYRGTEGRPIMLAMVADILRIGGELPESCFNNEEESSAGCTPGELKRKLVEHLFEKRTKPITRTLDAMGYLRKGVNADLLSQLLDESPEQAQKYLDEAAKLTLVKRRSLIKHPYFLHDEIYDLFELYWHRTTEEQEMVREKVLAHYDAEEERLLRKLKEDRESPDRVRWESEKWTMQVERLHYRLHFEPARGFADYFQRAEDAFDSRNRESDMQLRAELLRTIGEMRRTGSDSIILRDQLPLVYVEFDAAVRWAAREVWFNNDVESARQLLNKAQSWKPKEIQNQDFVLRWYWQLYNIILTMKSEGVEKFKQADQELETLEKALEELDRTDLIIKILKAFTRAYQGYADRMQGHYYKSVEHYQQAARIFRDLEMGSLISVLSNQAYAMAQIGDFQFAPLVLQEAYEEATTQGQPYWQAHVGNVQALVQTMDGHSRTALRYAENALKQLSGPIRNERLRGLVLLTMAKSLRYLWNDYVIEKHWRDEEALSSLWRAHELLEGNQKGLRLLKDKAGVDYYVDGLVESGCILRGMAWAHRRLEGRPRGISPEAFRQFGQADKAAEERFLEAAGISDINGDWRSQVDAKIQMLSGDPHLPVLALVNLGWHYHYRRRGAETKMVEDISKRVLHIDDIVKQSIPLDYHLPNINIEKEQAHILLWSLLGKMEMLLVHEMLWNWENLSSAQKKEHLRFVVRHATYSLEYNHLMGEISFDLRHAGEGLHHRLMQLSDWREFVLPLLYTYGEEVWTEFQVLLDGEKTTFLSWLHKTFGSEEKSSVQGKGKGKGVA